MVYKLWTARSPNDKTKGMEGPIPCLITVYKDKSFTFKFKKPPVTYYILKAVGLKKGGRTIGRNVIKQITFKEQTQKNC